MATNPESHTWDGSDSHAIQIRRWASSKQWRAQYIPGGNWQEPCIKLRFADMEVIVYTGDTVVFDGTDFSVD